MGAVGLLPPNGREGAGPPLSVHSGSDRSPAGVQPPGGAFRQAEIPRPSWRLSTLRLSNLNIASICYWRQKKPKLRLARFVHYLYGCFSAVADRLGVFLEVEIVARCTLPRSVIGDIPCDNLTL